MARRALVTGVAGFIGSSLAGRLIDHGFEVVGVDSMTSYYEPELKRINLEQVASPALQVVEEDLNTADLRGLVEGVDTVYHLAGQPGVRGSWGQRFTDYLSANVLATQKLLEAMHATRTRARLVYASSSSVYGDAESYPTPEDTTPRPRSPYGVTKLAGEHLCSLYAANHDIDVVSLRFFTVYGPRQRPDMAFTRFLAAAVDGTPIHVYGTGEQVRDFTYIDDVVGAVELAGKGRGASGAVYNVSGGGSHSVNEVLEMIAELTDAELDVRREAVALGDVTRTSADTRAIRRDLHWEPATQLREGLVSQLAWLRDRRVGA